MASDKEAEEAIKMFNGKAFKDRTIVVNEARPPRPREERPRFNKRRQF